MVWACCYIERKLVQRYPPPCTQTRADDQPLTCIPEVFTPVPLRLWPLHSKLRMCCSLCVCRCTNCAPLYEHLLKHDIECLLYQYQYYMIPFFPITSLTENMKRIKSIFTSKETFKNCSKYISFFLSSPSAKQTLREIDTTSPATPEAIPVDKMISEHSSSDLDTTLQPRVDSLGDNLGTSESHHFSLSKEVNVMKAFSRSL